MDAFERFLRQTPEGRLIERYRDNYADIDWGQHQKITTCPECGCYWDKPDLEVHKIACKYIVGLPTH